MDCSPSGSSVHGSLQARTWSGLPCPPPGDLPDLPTGRTRVVCISCVGRRALCHQRHLEARPSSSVLRNITCLSVGFFLFLAFGACWAPRAPWVHGFRQFWRGSTVISSCPLLRPRLRLLSRRAPAAGAAAPLLLVVSSVLQFRQILSLCRQANLPSFFLRCLLCY